MSNTIQLRRGLKSNLPTLVNGEPGFADDVGELYVGDGSTNYRFIPGDQYVKTTSDVVFNTVKGSNGMDAGSSLITNVQDPSNAQDAATKSYVDALEQALDIKDSVRAASQGNIDLTSSTDPNPIDGVSLSDGDRVLLMNQTTASENGIYIANTAIDPSTWTRAADADEDSEVTAGMFVFVEEGTNDNNKGFVLTTNDPVTVGTSDLNFTQFSGAGQISAGTGLSKTGDEINHKAASVHESGGAVEITHNNLALSKNDHHDVSTGLEWDGSGNVAHKAASVHESGGGVEIDHDKLASSSTNWSEAHHTKYALTNDLIQNEIDQIQKIDSQVISNTQWGYLAGLSATPLTVNSLIDCGSF